MCEALEELMEEALVIRENKAMKQGIERGMGIFIQDNLEENRSKEQIIAKLIRRFSLTRKVAEEYYDKYAVKVDG